MTRRPAVLLCACAVVLLAACAGERGATDAELTVTSDPAATAPDGATTSPTARRPSHTSGPSPTARPSRTADPPHTTTTAPEAIAFEAALVGGGMFEGGDYDGRDVALWFWAPW